jgi:hypothetical protein
MPRMHALKKSQKSFGRSSEKASAGLGGKNRRFLCSKDPGGIAGGSC